MTWGKSVLLTIPLILSGIFVVPSPATAERVGDERPVVLERLDAEFEGVLAALVHLAALAILAGSSGTALSRWYIERATRRRGDKLKDEGADL